ncbi:MAG: D-aminoacylase [bacterium]|nr:D-aminoacylase [bacterium]
MLDCIIRGARIVDGTGSPWYRSDVAVKDGKIAKIAYHITEETREVIEAEDMILAPGFIDIHSHSDFSLPVTDLAESRLLQGVTTEIGGNCGLSAAPVYPPRLEMLQKYVGFLTQDLKWDWVSFGEYLSAVRRAKLAVNFGCLVGHGTLRVAAMGFDDRTPTEAEMHQMKQMLRESMEQGAFGFSSGLIYPPGCYSLPSELSELAQVVVPFGGYYETHMRDEGDDLLASIEESAEVGRIAKVPVLVAHHKVTGPTNWGKGAESQQKISDFRVEGIDIVCDQYPYTAASTTITTIYPHWAHEGGVDGQIGRRIDGESRAKIRSEVLKRMNDSGRKFEDILIAAVGSEKNRHLEGLRVTEAAALGGIEPIDFVIELVIEEKASVAAVTFAMCEDDVKEIMKSPLTMIGSDGGSMPLVGPGKPHPRSFGTFVRVLAKYARDDGMFTFEEAVRKMTSLPAWRAKIFDRGLIRPGFWGDLVLINEVDLQETATYANPRQAPKGIEKVWVNGVLAVDKGNMTEVRAGKVLTINGK